MRGRAARRAEHVEPRARLWLGAVVALAVLAFLPAQLQAASAAGGGGGLMVDLEVYAVLYGVEAGSPFDSFNASVDVPGYGRVVFNVTVHYVEAPGWALERLREWLRLRYLWLGVPPWASGVALPPGWRYGWLPLEGFYEFLHGLSVEVLWSLNLTGWDDLVAVVGNVDNVSRVYLASGSRLLAGVRGLAGWSLFSFYDLSTVAAPHPPRFMPFAGEGVPVAVSTEPPVWMLGDAWGYVAGLVRGHVLYHLAGELLSEPWYAERVDVRVVFLYLPGARGRAVELYRGFNASLLEAMLETLDPHVDFRVYKRLEAANDTMVELLAPVRDEAGRLVLRYEQVSQLFRGGDGCRGVGERCVFTFYWIVAPVDAYMTYRWRLNFTGVDLGWAAVAAYPGYGLRALRSGLERVVAHEAGHAMGLWHPFQRGGEARWLMDFIYSVMSYCDNMTALLPRMGLQAYPAWRLALLHSLALLEEAPPEARGEALRLL
ncbi:MAG: hypothetical protein GXO15_06740, partial [Crenarchaeota archaeon]|nr:hypothetical protein [Thermoproteota archaeon]